MMLDAETRAVVLAEYQMRSESWKRPDPDERVECDVKACIVCGEELVGTWVKTVSGGTALRKPTRGQKVCTPCNKAGWRAMPCVVCGGPTRTWNWTSEKRGNTNRGKCPKCREAWHAERELVG